MPVYKIAIVGASSLLSRELKDVLSESPLASSSFALLDEEETQGQLEQVGDEVTFIQAISADAFDHADFTFFCGTENLTRRHWRQALRAGSTVLDLSGALDQETGVLIRAPWLGTECRRRQTCSPPPSFPRIPPSLRLRCSSIACSRPLPFVSPRPRSLSRPANSAVPLWMSCISRR